jgi:hypothetical protein
MDVHPPKNGMYRWSIATSSTWPGECSKHPPAAQPQNIPAAQPGHFHTSQLRGVIDPMSKAANAVDVGHIPSLKGCDGKKTSRFMNISWDIMICFYKCMTYAMYTHTSHNGICNATWWEYDENIKWLMYNKNEPIIGG